MTKREKRVDRKRKRRKPEATKQPSWVLEGIRIERQAEIRLDAAEDSAFPQDREKWTDPH